MNENFLRSRHPFPGAVGVSKGLFERRWRGTAIMGVLNVTPDSFSDGGAYDDVEAAVSQGRRLAAAGAMVLDVGGESTRPGAAAVPVEVELSRVIPVLRRLLRATEAIISVDTSKPEVAHEALREGAHLINDVGGLREPEMLRLCGRLGVPVVIMHMKGEPGSMQDDPRYEDVVGEVRRFLGDAAERATEAGVPDVLLDPGIGFGKTLDHNLTLLRSLEQLAPGQKLLVGASRKGFISKLAGEGPPAGRDPGSIAVHLHSAGRGAAMVRVHDVAGHAQALRVWEHLHG